MVTSDPALLDAFRRQCLTAYRNAVKPERYGTREEREEAIAAVSLVFLAWQGQAGVTRDDLIGIFREIERSPQPLRDCWPKPPQPGTWTNDVPPAEAVETRYVVIRPGPGCPPGLLPPSWNGRWFDRQHIESAKRLGVPPLAGAAAARAIATTRAIATGRFEQREDGALAEIYEVQP